MQFRHFTNQIKTMSNSGSSISMYSKFMTPSAPDSCYITPAAAAIRGGSPVLQPRRFLSSSNPAINDSASSKMIAMKTIKSNPSSPSLSASTKSETNLSQATVTSSSSLSSSTSCPQLSTSSPSSSSSFLSNKENEPLRRTSSRLQAKIVQQQVSSSSKPSSSPSTSLDPADLANRLDKLSIDQEAQAKEQQQQQKENQQLQPHQRQQRQQVDTSSIPRALIDIHPDDPRGSLKKVAAMILSRKCSRIIVMSGAGISVNAGIPDFRTPGTGLYDNLQKYNLPTPTAMFDINFFRKTPEPFFNLAKELFPGMYAPTFVHHFLKSLHRKGVLLRNFTQNIDTLELVAGLPREAIVEAHGSFGSAHCINPKCKTEYSLEELKKNIFQEKIPKCSKCSELVKPDITFFGESLPSRFFQLAESDFFVCDLLIVIGTSLQVAPFNSLVDRVLPPVPRLLINREEVGSRRTRSHNIKGFDFTNERDHLWLGDCDEGIRHLARYLGVDAEVQANFESTKAKVHRHRQHLSSATPAKK